MFMSVETKLALENLSTSCLPSQASTVLLVMMFLRTHSVLSFAATRKNPTMIRNVGAGTMEMSMVVVRHVPTFADYIELFKKKLAKNKQKKKKMK